MMIAQTIFGLSPDTFSILCITIIAGTYIRIESWRTNTKIAKNTEVTKGTQTIVNGRMDRLLEEVRESSYAKGLIEGSRREAEKAASQALVEKNLAVAAQQQSQIEQLKDRT